MRRNTQAIRLAGRSVVSLETVPESALVAGEAIPQHALHIDWSAVLRGAGFDRDQAVYIIGTKIERPRRMPAGWSPQKQERIRKSVSRRLKALKLLPLETVVLKRDASGTAELLRFHSGAQVWSLR